jgi:DNA-directed RNA polymerase alpha subunit
MPQFLIDHLEGCTPVKPCASCQALSYLRSRLKPTEYQEFAKFLEAGTGRKIELPAIAEIDMSKSWEEILPRLSTRLSNGLKNGNVQTIGDLLKQTRQVILRIPNISDRSADELDAALATKGLEIPRE